MKTMILQTTIGPNGTIHLDIPSDLPPGPAEIKLTIQPIPRSIASGSGIHRSRSWPTHSTHGLLRQVRRPEARPVAGFFSVSCRKTMTSTRPLMK